MERLQTSGADGMIFLFERCSSSDDEDDEGNVFLDVTVEHWLPIIPAIGLFWEF